MVEEDKVEIADGLIYNKSVVATSVQKIANIYIFSAFLMSGRPSSPTTV